MVTRRLRHLLDIEGSSAGERVIVALAATVVVAMGVLVLDVIALMLLALAQMFGPW